MLKVLKFVNIVKTLIKLANLVRNLQLFLMKLLKLFTTLTKIGNKTLSNFRKIFKNNRYAFITTLFREC